ncbi:hypothetical protein Pmani_035929 [Petrolisthes manimaculis]|uniref:Secreted protein n=1 Tax=Petrolisthes manimaculis TaxID=1843537 RepID=A0AAE1TPY8_9EUCA|nr:hypothetical protein Pmani_035929 [Petrolisthes manimaculis]
MGWVVIVVTLLQAGTNCDGCSKDEGWLVIEARERCVGDSTAVMEEEAIGGEGVISEIAVVVLVVMV